MAIITSEGAGWAGTSVPTGISILAFQRLCVYTDSSPNEPSHFLFRARIVPAARIARSGVLKRNLRIPSTALYLQPHSKSRPVLCQWYRGTRQALVRVPDKVSYLEFPF